MELGISSNQLRDLESRVRTAKGPAPRLRGYLRAGGAPPENDARRGLDNPSFCCSPAVWMMLFTSPSAALTMSAFAAASKDMRRGRATPPSPPVRRPRDPGLIGSGFAGASSSLLSSEPLLPRAFSGVFASSFFFLLSHIGMAVERQGSAEASKHTLRT